MTEATTTQSLDEINAAIADLQAKAAEVRKQARAAAIERCNFFIQEFNLAMPELKFSEAKAKEAKAPTHRGQNGELWTEANQGRKPNWITALIAGGGDLESVPHSCAGVIMSQQPEALRLVNEYRPTMPHDVLNSWAQDAKVMIARLTAENEALKAAVSEAVAEERMVCAELMEQQHTWITNVAASALIRARGTP